MTALSSGTNWKENFPFKGHEVLTFLSSIWQTASNFTNSLCLSVCESIHCEALHCGRWANTRCKYVVYFLSLFNTRIMHSQCDVGLHVKQIIKGFTDTLDVLFFQGMGMVVHQALTEYNRWDLKMSVCRKRVFNDAVHDVLRPLASSL